MFVLVLAVVGRAKGQLEKLKRGEIRHCVRHSPVIEHKQAHSTGMFYASWLQ